MNVTPQQVLAVISVASSVTTAIFLGAYFLGKLRGRLERTEDLIGDHAALLTNYGRRIEKTEDDVRAIRGDRRHGD